MNQPFTVRIKDRDEDYKAWGVTKGEFHEWELGQRAPLDSGFFEWWYFDARFDDGHAIVVVFWTKFMKDIHVGPRPYVDLRILKPDGTILDTQATVTDDFTFSSEKLDIRIGQSRIVGNYEKIHVKAVTEGAECDLTYTAVVPPNRLGAGGWEFSDKNEYLGWHNPIPAGVVTGTLAYNGHRVLLNGTGYHDHDWGNKIINTCIKKWYWGRAATSEIGTVNANITWAKQYGNAVENIFFYSKAKKRIAFDGSKATCNFYEVEKDPDSGKDIAGRVEFIHREGKDEVIVTYQKIKPIMVVDQTTRMMPEAVERLTVVFGKLDMWYHRYAALVTIDTVIDGTKEHCQLPGIYEVMDHGDM